MARLASSLQLEMFYFIFTIVVTVLPLPVSNETFVFLPQDAPRLTALVSNSKPYTKDAADFPPRAPQSQNEALHRHANTSPAPQSFNHELHPCVNTPQTPQLRLPPLRLPYAPPLPYAAQEPLVTTAALLRSTPLVTTPTLLRWLPLRLLWSILLQYAPCRPSRPCRRSSSSPDTGDPPRPPADAVALYFAHLYTNNTSSPSTIAFFPHTHLHLRSTHAHLSEPPINRHLAQNTTHLPELYYTKPSPPHSTLLSRLENAQRKIKITPHIHTRTYHAHALLNTHTNPLNTHTSEPRIYYLTSTQHSLQLCYATHIRIFAYDSHFSFYTLPLLITHTLPFYTLLLLFTHTFPFYTLHNLVESTHVTHQSQFPFQLAPTTLITNFQHSNIKITKNLPLNPNSFKQYGKYALLANFLSFV